MWGFCFFGGFCFSFFLKALNFSTRSFCRVSFSWYSNFSDLVFGVLFWVLVHNKLYFCQTFRPCNVRTKLSSELSKTTRGSVSGYEGDKHKKTYAWSESHSKTAKVRGLSVIVRIYLRYRTWLEAKPPFRGLWWSDCNAISDHHMRAITI